MFHSFKEWSIRDLGKLKLLIYELNNDYSKRLRKIDVESFETLNANDKDFDSYIGDGLQGIGIENDFMDYPSEKLKLTADYDEDRKIKYFISPVLDNFGKYQFSIPKLEMLIKLDSRFSTSTIPNAFRMLKINTAELMVLKGKPSKFNGEFCPRTYFFYDKENEEWHEKEFHGSYLTMKAYGSWVAGALADDIRKLPSSISRVSISGNKYWLQEKTDYGNPQEVRFQEVKMRPYGKLFLYNFKTKEYIEWDALENGERQGDSEILYVDSRVVIYRINDSIFSAVIGEGHIEKIKLLIHDEFVPYIHWAFIPRS